MPKATAYIKFLVFTVFCANAITACSQTITPNGTTTAPWNYAPATPPPGYVNPKINYVRSWQPQKPITDPNLIHITTPIQEVQQSTQYLDGLGRLLQSVGKGISPSGRDVVAPVVYDDFGREMYKYVPYTSTATDGSFKSNPF